MNWVQSFLSFIELQQPKYFSDSSTIEFSNRYGLRSSEDIFDSSVIIQHCSFISCRQNRPGAALFIIKSNVQINECQFYKCSAPRSASCYLNSCLSISINNSLFAKGNANCVPAISFNMEGNEGNASLSNSNFTQNNAKQFVSAIRFACCQGIVHNCHFHKNYSPRAGCIYDFIMIPSESIFCDCCFLNNTSNSEGSCFSLYHHSYKGNIKSSYFIGNYCNKNGNSIVLKSDYGDIKIIDCMFSGIETAEIENIYIENGIISLQKCSFNQTVFPIVYSSINSEISQSIRNINP